MDADEVFGHVASVYEIFQYSTRSKNVSISDVFINEPVQQ